MLAFLFTTMKSQLAIAGKELIKGNFGNAFKAATTFVSERLIPSQYNGLSRDFWHFSSDGSEIHFSFTGPGSPAEAYTKCPPLQAVINRKARALLNGNVWLLNSKGKEAVGDVANRVRKILVRPNPIQTWDQFDAQIYIYTQLWGYCPILTMYPTGFDASYTTAMWCIPPWMCTIEEQDSGMFYFAKSPKDLIKSIQVTYKSTITYLNLDFVYIVKEFQPSMNSVVIPDSRVRAVEMPINNIIGTYESRNVIINKRGPTGIFSQDPGTGQYGALPAKSGYKEALQEDFKKYGLMRKQWNVIVTEAAIKYQQVGANMRDMMFFEEVEDDIMRICDTFTFPSALISSPRGPNVSNTKEFNQQLYNDGVIPESLSIYGQFNEMLNLNQYNLKLERDFSKLTVLQKDKKQEADARKVLGEALLNEFYANLITFNRVLELLGEDTRTGGDIYYWQAINEGIQFALPGGGAMRSNQSNNQNSNNGQESQT